MKTTGFMFKTLFCMYCGNTKNSIIRQKIGLNEYCKNSFYKDRSSYYFGCVIVPRLTKQNLIVKIKHGHYTLTEAGKKIVEDYLKSTV